MNRHRERRILYGETLESNREFVSTLDGSTRLEEAEVEFRWLALREVREDFPDGGGELEPVSRAGAGDEHLRAVPMPIDPEMFVRRVRVEAVLRKDSPRCLERALCFAKPIYFG